MKINSLAFAGGGYGSTAAQQKYGQVWQLVEPIVGGKFQLAVGGSKVTLSGVNDPTGAIRQQVADALKQAFPDIQHEVNVRASSISH